MPVYPSVRYRDARAAIEWLDRALAFTPRVVYDGPDGTVAHAELVAGDGLIMLGSERAEHEDRYERHAGLSWVYVGVPDTETLFERAVAAGAEVVRPLEDTDYGSRDFSVRDLEGNLWSFGTYSPKPGDPAD